MGQYEAYQVLKKNKGKWMTVKDISLRGFKAKSKHMVQLARYCDKIEIMRDEVTSTVYVRMQEDGNDKNL